MLLPATLNSSWPCGIGRLIQYEMRFALASLRSKKMRPPPCSVVSSGLASRRVSAGAPIAVAPCEE